MTYLKISAIVLITLLLDACANTPMLSKNDLKHLLQHSDV